jgi:hypothetical protein
MVLLGVVCWVLSSHLSAVSSNHYVELQTSIVRKQTLRFFFLQTMVTVAVLPLADVVLEKAMHKCILKPLKGHVEAMLKDFHMADGSWKQLKENLQLVRQRNPQELGVFAPTPDLVDVEKIKVKFMTMQKMYSPEKKVMLLLRVCKLIYTVMENNSGEAAEVQALGHLPPGHTRISVCGFLISPSSPAVQG